MVLPVRIFLTLIACTSACASAGLLPTTFTDADSIKGVVVDARTRKPLAEVEVTVGTSERSKTVRTKADGSFLIPSQRHVEIPIMGGRDAYVAVPTHLFITHPAYARIVREIKPSYASPFDAPKLQDIGVIRLVPKPRHPSNQAMQPTAGRRTTKFLMTLTLHPAATRALASGG
jgi:hypothetical protein